jgi:hypothetical protein
VNIFFIIYTFGFLFLAIYSLFNWEMALYIFFVLIQFTGFLKRFIFQFGMTNFEYNFLVAVQYVFILVLISVCLKENFKCKLSNNFFIFWLVVMMLLFFLSIVFSPFGLFVSMSLFMLQYFSIFFLIPGFFLSKSYLFKILKMLVYTAPIHAVYEIQQFLFGPFNFEINFMNNKSAIIDSGQGDFFRGIPLYDNVEPLYIHYCICILFILSFKQLSFKNIFLISIIFIAVILMGNRSGILLLLLGLLIWLFLKAKFINKKIILFVFSLIMLASLNVFSYLFYDLIDDIGYNFNVGDTDFSQRLGTLGTFSDRIIGRQNAFDNLSILGLGMGSSGLGLSVLANKGLGFSKVNHSLFAHDLIGELLLDIGIIGALVFVSIFFYIIYYFKYDSLNNIFMATVLSSLLLGSLLGGSLTYGRAGFYVFFFLGILFQLKKFNFFNNVKIKNSNFSY